MNFRHPEGVLHSFSIKNIFYYKMDLRLFYFYVTTSYIFRRESFILKGLPTLQSNFIRKSIVIFLESQALQRDLFILEDKTS